MLKFGHELIFKRLALRGSSDPALVRGADYSRITDMMFVLGGSSSLRDKFIETPGGQAYWRIFTKAHGEYHGAKVDSPAKNRSTRIDIVSKLALEFHEETGGWFFALRYNTIKQFSLKDVFKTVEGYLVDADTTSLVEKRRAIPKGKAVIMKHGIRKLVKKRERGGERLTIGDSMKAKLLNEKEVTIVKLEKK